VLRVQVHKGVLYQREANHSTTIGTSYSRSAAQLATSGEEESEPTPSENSSQESRRMKHQTRVEKEMALKISSSRVDYERSP